MRQLVRTGKKNPRIVQLARMLTATLPQKNYRAEIEAIHAYVRDNMRYVRDPTNVETLQDVDALLNSMSGDCDEKSVLVAALLEAIGHPTRFVAIATREPEKYNHVYVETRYIDPRRQADEWLTVETTEPWALGQRPPPGVVKSRMVVYN